MKNSWEEKTRQNSRLIPLKGGETNGTANQFGKNTAAGEGFHSSKIRQRGFRNRQFQYNPARSFPYKGAEAGERETGCGKNARGQIRQHGIQKGRFRQCDGGCRIGSAERRSRPCRAGGAGSAGYGSAAEPAACIGCRGTFRSAGGWTAAGRHSGRAGVGSFAGGAGPEKQCGRPKS